jgi:O-antigen/teichoic acid export membrane protein
LAASTVISTVAIIIFARLLPPSEYGIVTIALTSLNLIAIFRNLGIDSAINKYIAQYRSEKKANAGGVLTAGTLSELVLGHPYL